MPHADLLRSRVRTAADATPVIASGCDVSLVVRQVPA